MDRRVRSNGNGFVATILRLAGTSASQRGLPVAATLGMSIRNTVVRKVPFFVLAAAACSCAPVDTSSTTGSTQSAISSSAPPNIQHTKSMANVGDLAYYIRDDCGVTYINVLAYDYGGNPASPPPAPPVTVNVSQYQWCPPYNSLNFYFQPADSTYVQINNQSASLSDASSTDGYGNSMELSVQWTGTSPVSQSTYLERDVGPSGISILRTEGSSRSATISGTLTINGVSMTLTNDYVLYANIGTNHSVVMDRLNP
jgi:hypothetical protein